MNYRATLYVNGKPAYSFVREHAYQAWAWCGGTLRDLARDWRPAEHAAMVDNLRDCPRAWDTVTGTLDVGKVGPLLVQFRVNPTDAPITKIV